MKVKVTVMDWVDFIERMNSEEYLSLNDILEIDGEEISEKEFCIEQDDIESYNEETKTAILTGYCSCNLEDYLEEIEENRVPEKDWDLEIDEMKERR